jgi:hypothetical protein
MQTDIGYHDRMSQLDLNTNQILRSGGLAFLPISLIILFIGLLGLLAWSANGSALFMSLIESGLAWCL